MSQEQNKIRENVNELLDKPSDTNDTNYTDAEIDKLIKLITGEKSGGGEGEGNTFSSTMLTEKFIIGEEGDGGGE